MEKLDYRKIEGLKIIAKNIRLSIIEMLEKAGSGHTAGSLDLVEILTILYFHTLQHKPQDPSWEERDRLVLSCGHTCPALYATLAYAGYFPKDELSTLRQFGSRLQGHPDRQFLDILETSSGPLGSGLSQAVGMAMVDKIYNDSQRKFYAILSDGEFDEGNTWEALMLAAKEKLSNLIIIVDRNYIQIGGNTENVMPLFDLKDKIKSFNCFVDEVDGHDFEELDDAFRRALNNKNSPTVIVAKTISAKGVKKWENDYRWHGKAPNKEEAQMAIKEINNG
ncbi:MAG TPA: transketolase [Candidatus Paceibacterota bacterium]|nr:transketolase [Candidatus Paceibacterota bacterium]HQO71022.1 transketolase [Candidatus Paceibacterota bacterium]